jgi:hypothetical protein
MLSLLPHSLAIQCAALKQALQKPHDFRQREHKPEGFEEEFLERREDAPELI